MTQIPLNISSAVILLGNMYGIGWYSPPKAIQRGFIDDVLPKGPHTILRSLNRRLSTNLNHIYHIISCSFEYQRVVEIRRDITPMSLTIYKFPKELFPTS